MFKKFLFYIIVLLVLLVGVGSTWLVVAPPELIRVATNFAAKTVCSGHFISGRSIDDVMIQDVQAQGHPIMKIIAVKADDTTVRASLFGLFGQGVAVLRPGLGCATAPNADTTKVANLSTPIMASNRAATEWPEGTKVTETANPDLAKILNDSALIGPGARAVIVVKNGKIIGETYAEGFTAQTPVNGWSMSKTVTAVLVGMAIKDGKLARDKNKLLPEWSDDPRGEIMLTDLMGMSSGLQWDEEYGDVSDVTRMLYLSPDMADFAARRPLSDERGKSFNYSSGTSVLLSKIWQNAIGDNNLAFPQERLFKPLGMASAVLEADATGTFVGSSYLYATPRDWARLALFLSNGGVWNGQNLLPSGYVDWMITVHPASQGAYGHGQIWRRGPEGIAESVEAAREYNLPEKTYWLRGYDGQSIAIMPDQNLIVLRMGLTPSRYGYRPQKLVDAVLKALL